MCPPGVLRIKMPSFLAGWRVRGRPAVQGPAGTGSVGDGVGEGASAGKLKSQHNTRAHAHAHARTRADPAIRWGQSRGPYFSPVPRKYF